MELIDNIAELFGRKRQSTHANSIGVGRLKKKLTNKERIMLFEQFHLYLKNNIKLDLALTEMYNIYSDDGRKPKNKIAVLVRDVSSRLAAGRQFSEALAPYLEEGQYFLISAGERSSYMKEAMTQCIRLINCEGQINESMRKATIYNIFLAFMLAAILVIAATVLIPKAMTMVTPQQLHGFGKAVYNLSEFTTHYGYFVVMGVVAIMMVVKWAKPNYIGSFRSTLDKMWPFSLYRIVNGAVFLTSLSSLMQANVSVDNALAQLAENSSPYLKQRLNATRSSLHQGDGLGDALAATGYNFPDKQAIRHLRILGSRQGADEAIGSFADDWLQRTIKETDNMANIIRNVGMVAVFAVAGMIIGGVAVIQQTAQATLGAGM